MYKVIVNDLVISIETDQHTAYDVARNAVNEILEKTGEHVEWQIEEC